MGLFINIGNAGFREARKGEYVDKSGLIGVVNGTLGTEWKFSCVSRARRFGKSVAARMLCAYYDHSCQSRELFADLEIARDPSFEEHLNKYPVIYLDMSDFVSRFRDAAIVQHIEQDLRRDILAAYPDVAVEPTDDLMQVLVRIADATGQQFVFIIDEWDAICREFGKSEPSAMDDYVNWLRRMFKSVSASRVFAVVYMTGILPIKKYKTESALNNFSEYSMVKPGPLASYFGFTKDEVRGLAGRYGMDFDELEKWYDGYRMGNQSSMFNPNSVMQALHQQSCSSYWASTGAYDAVANYIQMNYEGLKDDVVCLLGGEHVDVNATKFQNDMSVVRSRDEVLTVLIHLGYLSYDAKEEACYVPNREVAGELVNAVEETDWEGVIASLQASKRLLKALLRGDEEAVARGVEAAHSEHTSILSYNDENSMACVLSLAFYYARNDYVIHRELATGKGYADLVLLPRKGVESPAIVIELKYNDTVDTAISQIQQRCYSDKVQQYADRSATQETLGSSKNLMLVGISYDRKTKQHHCRIEQCHNDRSSV